MNLQQIDWPPRATTQVLIGTVSLVSPISIRIQEIEGPRRSIIPQEVRNAKPLDASIHRIYSKDRDPAPSWSKVIGSKFTKESSTDVYARFQMNLADDTILPESLNSKDLGMSPVNRTDELGSVFSPTTIIGSETYVYNWLPRSHCISESTADRLSGTKSKHNYNFLIYFETRTDEVVDQDFWHKNDFIIRPPLDSTPMSQLPLDSTPLCTYTPNGTTSPSDSIPVGTKAPTLSPLTLPTNSPALSTDFPE